MSQGMHQMSEMLYNAIHDVESAAKALLTSADVQEFEENKANLRDALRYVASVRDAEIKAAQTFVRAAQANRLRHE